MDQSRTAILWAVIAPTAASPHENEKAGKAITFPAFRVNQGVLVRKLDQKWIRAPNVTAEFDSARSAPTLSATVSLR